MLIERRIEDTGGSLPEAYAALSSEILVPIYNVNFKSKRKLRHPSGIYKVSLRSITDAFLTLLDELERIVSTRCYATQEALVNRWDDHLIICHDRLLRCLMDHMDDCLSVLMCFFETYQEFKQNVYVKTYEREITEYRDHIATIVNHMKHQQGRLRLIIFENYSLDVLGYFVEGVQEDGAIGPAPQVHSPSDTAFSFNRDLRYHLFNIYAVSHYLAKAVYSITQSELNAELNASEDKDIAKVALRVSNLPMMFFPDEVEKPCPTVSVKKENNALLYLALCYPDLAAKPLKLRTGSVRLVQRADGISTKFVIPYRATLRKHPK